MSEFYDIVDSEGNVVETAEQQKQEAEPVPLDRKPPKLAPSDIAKARKALVTINHGKVIACGHSLDLEHQPTKRNCEHCWFAWFANHKEVVDQCVEMHTADGGKLIEQLQGTKFLQRYRQFMSTLAQWHKESEEKNEQTS